MRPERSRGRTKGNQDDHRPDAAHAAPPRGRLLVGAGPRDDTATGLVWFSLEVAAQEILQDQQDRLRQAGAPAVAIENGIETADPWGTKVRLIKV